VTYTEVSSPFEDLSDIGSPGVDGLPMMPEDPYAYVEAALQAPPSPDYVHGPEEPEQAPPSPYFVLEPVYPEFMPPEDDVLLAEEQPLPAADSPGYITESDPKEDLKVDDEDPKEDPADYPTDRDDDDDEESSVDDDDDEEEDKDEDEEEEEHLAPANSVPPPVDRFLAIYTPLPSPLTSYSPPLLDSPTQPLGYRAAIIRLRAESPSTSHPLPIVLPHTRASMAMMRAAAPSTYILAPRSGILPSETPPSGTPPLLLIPLPTPSPHLLLPSTDCRAGVSEVMLSPRKRLCITLGSRFEVSESSSAPTTRPTKDFRRDYGFVATLDDEIRRDLERDVGYGITDTWDEMVEDIQGILEATDVAELSKRITNFVMTIRQDTDEIYRRLDDAQDDRSLMSGQLNLLRRDRRAHAHTTRLMESEARLSCEAWVQSMDASDTTRSEVRALRTTVLAQQTEVKDL
ncbi:hypothetical protein Tco_1029727, partial [Tanacetum coccineum]